jgi:hypothetical protein
MNRTLILFPLLLIGCFATAATPALLAGSERIRIGKSDPAGLVELGPIEAVHGSGCGGFGEKGTYDGAVTVLRNEAARMGASYVEIFTLTEPHSETGCFDNRFVIRGTAWAERPGTVATERQPN